MERSALWISKRMENSPDPDRPTRCGLFGGENRSSHRSDREPSWARSMVLYVRDRQESHHLIVTMRAQGWSVRALARRFQVSPNTLRASPFPERANSMPLCR